MKKTARATDDVTSDIRGHCLLTRTRLVSRVITAIYDAALRPYGLNSPQFSLLASIHSLGQPTRAEIGRHQQLDRSTLTRNLQVMIAEGWLEEVDDSAGGRGRPVVLSSLGKNLLRKASAGWRVAQAKAGAVLGENGTKDIKRIADALASSSSTSPTRV